MSIVITKIRANGVSISDIDGTNNEGRRFKFKVFRLYYPFVLNQKSHEITSQVQFKDQGHPLVTLSNYPFIAFVCLVNSARYFKTVQHFQS